MGVSVAILRAPACAVIGAYAVIAGSVGIGATACGDQRVGPDAASADAAPRAPDAAVPEISEAADCGGLPLRARAGAPLLVSALRIAEDSIDLDGDGFADNALSPLANRSDSLTEFALGAGTLALALEMFDRTQDPDVCLKLGLYRGACKDVRCDFTDTLPDHVALDPTTIDGQVPVSRLRAMRTTILSDLVLTGPGYLELVFPIVEPQLEHVFYDFILPITVSYARGKLVETGISGLHVAGVMQAFRMGQVAAPLYAPLSLAPGDTVLDALFANRVGSRLLFLPPDNGCVSTQVDLDEDGLEIFCDTRPSDGVFRVDLCIDGSGAKVYDGDNGLADCSQAMKHGVPRFVDGLAAQVVLDARLGIAFE